MAEKHDSNFEKEGSLHGNIVSRYKLESYLLIHRLKDAYAKFFEKKNKEGAATNRDEDYIEITTDDDSRLKELLPWLKNLEDVSEYRNIIHDRVKQWDTSMNKKGNDKSVVDTNKAEVREVVNYLDAQWKLSNLDQMNIKEGSHPLPLGEEVLYTVLDNRGELPIPKEALKTLFIVSLVGISLLILDTNEKIRNLFFLSDKVLENTEKVIHKRKLVRDEKAFSKLHEFVLKYDAQAEDTILKATLDNPDITDDQVRFVENIHMNFYKYWHNEVYVTLAVTAARTKFKNTVTVDAKGKEMTAGVLQYSPDAVLSFMQDERFADIFGNAQYLFDRKEILKKIQSPKNAFNLQMIARYDVALELFRKVNTSAVSPLLKTAMEKVKNGLKLDLEEREKLLVTIESAVLKKFGSFPNVPLYSAQDSVPKMKTDVLSRFSFSSSLHSDSTIANPNGFSYATSKVKVSQPSQTQFEKDLHTIIHSLPQRKL